VRDIDGMQVALGRWVRARVPAGAPVAAHDIGAIGYISDHPIVDIEGLVTPRFLALKREQPVARRSADIDAEVVRLGAHTSSCSRAPMRTSSRGPDCGRSTASPSRGPPSCRSPRWPCI